MKKLILYLISMFIGVCAGIIFHCSFMLVEAEGCFMLPTIEPGQQVVVSLLGDVDTGDVVAFYPEYYTLDGEGNIVFRRVKEKRSGEVVLMCDTALTKDEEIRMSEEDILGKVIFLNLK